MPKVQPIPNAPSSGRGRRGRHVRVSTALAEINVVPLVDVMLVLLIIFMVAAPMMTQGMQVNLPKAQRSTNPPVQKNLYVTIPADFGKTNKVQIGDDAPFTADLLPERMRQALMERTDKSVFIRTDQGVTMQQFMSVTDKLKEAGVEKVAIATRPAGSRQ